MRYMIGGRINVGRNRINMSSILLREHVTTSNTLSEIYKLAFLLWVDGSQKKGACIDGSKCLQTSIEATMPRENMLFCQRMRKCGIAGKFLDYCIGIARRGDIVHKALLPLDYGLFAIEGGERPIQRVIATRRRRVG